MFRQETQQIELRQHELHLLHRDPNPAFLQINLQMVNHPADVTVFVSTRSFYGCLSRKGDRQVDVINSFAYGSPGNADTAS